MQKTYCDICNCEMSSSSSIAVILKEKCAKTEVIIHHEGRTLDICNECRNKLVRYAFYDMRGMVDPVNMGF